MADIHLQPTAQHPINNAFIQFLQDEAPKADALYILGDLFEMWVGDDIGLQLYAPFITELKKLTENGLAIYVQYGNRDFLMRKAFCQATGVKLLDDMAIVSLYGEPYILMHGDSLCTDDTGYQRMRKIVRNRFVQWLFLHLSRKRRLNIGNKMRQNSKQHSQAKPQQIMDVNQHAVCEVFKQNQQASHLIHGHTHRPKHHIIEAEHKTLHRWVLGDWRPQAQILKIDADGPRFETFPGK
ncbi:MAG: UDP-2,3-diacylglucosamine diphosphatase [Thiomicrorhabdus sp.]|nr:UDP-2,3-diacylglucosamine diphosphatase [Thiomicrorhabdus sp.]